MMYIIYSQSSYSTFRSDLVTRLVVCGLFRQRFANNNDVSTTGPTPGNGVEVRLHNYDIDCGDSTDIGKVYPT